MTASQPTLLKIMVPPIARPGRVHICQQTLFIVKINTFGAPERSIKMNPIPLDEHSSLKQPSLLNENEGVARVDSNDTALDKFSSPHDVGLPMESNAHQSSKRVRIEHMGIESRHHFGVFSKPKKAKQTDLNSSSIGFHFGQTGS